MPPYDNDDNDEQNVDGPTRMNQAAEWTTRLESGGMSDEERVDFHAWLDEPRNEEALHGIRNIVELIQELPDNKIKSLRKTSPIMDWARAMSAPPKVVSPPGQALARAAMSLLTANAYKRYVEPVIADMQQDYFDARAAGHIWRARWIAIRVHLLIVPGWLYAFVTGKLSALLRQGR